MIPIRNIYCMLAYAFRTLREQHFRNLATEDFSNATELCAEILLRGVKTQVKRGLGRGYVETSNALSSLRGKIEVTESLKARSILKRQLVCSYDEFSPDTRMNRIIKATLILLLRANISKGRKKEIKRLLPFFADVAVTNLSIVDWHFRYDRNNQTYRMLLNVCWLIYKGLLQTQADGSQRFMDFLDEQRMCRLYEKFIFEYYRQEHPEVKTSASYINWALDDGFEDMLPIMKSDVMLSWGNKVLIIDAKYYSNTTAQRFDKRSIHSANLYQIFTYVKNKETELAASGLPHEVAGMLLYARSDDAVQPDGAYQMSGNLISVKTLDLNVPFEEICSQLDGILEAHLASKSCGDCRSIV